MHVYGIAAQIGVATPDLLEDGVPRHHLTDTLYEKEQDVELAPREVDARPCSSRRSRRRVHHKVADLVDRGPAGTAPVQRPDPGQKLVELERLGQVVVGSRIETLDTVCDLSPRREQEHGDVPTGAAQRSHDLGARHTGQHPIEQHHVVLAGRGRGESRPGAPSSGLHVGFRNLPLVNDVLAVRAVDVTKRYGDLVCRLDFTDDQGAHQVGKVDVSVNSNACYVANGTPAALLGFTKIADSRGRDVINPTAEFEGCFDPKR